MENIQTAEKFAEILKDDSPVTKDGQLLSDQYAQAIKEGILVKTGFEKLIREMVFKMMILFPRYPQAVNFIWWVKCASLDSRVFNQILIKFLDTEWTEDKYPDRSFERLFIIEHILERELIDIRWVKSTSKKALEENPWKEHDIDYLYFRNENGEIAFQLLESLATKPQFVQNVTFRINFYLADFTESQIRYFLKPAQEKISSEDWHIIDKWLIVFGKKNP